MAIPCALAGRPLHPHEQKAFQVDPPRISRSSATPSSSCVWSLRGERLIGTLRVLIGCQTLPARRSIQVKIQPFHNVTTPMPATLFYVSHLGLPSPGSGPGLDLLHLLWFSLVIRGAIPERFSICSRCRAAARRARRHRGP
jgi:hypothetical protein